MKKRKQGGKRIETNTRTGKMVVRDKGTGRYARKGRKKVKQ